MYTTGIPSFLCSADVGYRFHPVRDGGDAPSKVVSHARSTRAVDLCVLGVRMRLQSEGLNQPHQVRCIQQKQDRPDRPRNEPCGTPNRTVTDKGVEVDSLQWT